MSLCADYDNRPQLCREYQAGQDGLCVMRGSKQNEEINEIHSA